MPKFAFWTILAFILVTENSVFATPAVKYGSIYDNIDFDAIAKSPRLIRMYLNCLLDKGMCNPEGKEFKKNIPDALQNGCAKCTKAQRKGTGKILKFLTEQKPEWYQEIKAKYDPEGIAEKKYLKQLIADSEI